MTLLTDKRAALVEAAYHDPDARVDALDAYLDARDAAKTAATRICTHCHEGCRQVDLRGWCTDCQSNEGEGAEGPKVDWRRRALAAESELEAIRHVLAE